jgi:hypothetical protein
MAGSTKVEEDELMEKMGDAKINEEKILEAKLSFPFVLSKLCVMKIMRSN